MSANALSILLVAAVIVIGVIGYFIGKRDGYYDGYERGWAAGSTDSTDRLLRRHDTPSVDLGDYPKSNVVKTIYHGGGTWR